MPEKRKHQKHQKHRTDKKKRKHQKHRSKPEKTSKLMTLVKTFTSPETYQKLKKEYEALDPRMKSIIASILLTFLTVAIDNAPFDFKPLLEQLKELDIIMEKGVNADNALEELKKKGGKDLHFLINIRKVPFVGSAIRLALRSVGNKALKYYLIELLRKLGLYAAPTEEENALIDWQKYDPRLSEAGILDIIRINRGRGISIFPPTGDTASNSTAGWELQKERAAAALDAANAHAELAAAYGAGSAGSTSGSETTEIQREALHAPRRGPEERDLTGYKARLTVEQSKKLTTQQLFTYFRNAEGENMSKTRYNVMKELHRRAKGGDENYMKYEEYMRQSDIARDVSFFTYVQDPPPDKPTAPGRKDMKGKGPA